MTGGVTWYTNNIIFCSRIHPVFILLGLTAGEVVPYMHNLGIVVQAWYPFGARGHTSEILNDPTIVEIAEAHDRTAAQVILRWHLQRGVVAIPGSSDPDAKISRSLIFPLRMRRWKELPISTAEQNSIGIKLMRRIFTCHLFKNQKIENY